jgi:hypothetical protein
VTAGRAPIWRYALLPPAGAGNEAAVTAASVPPLSGGPDSHGSAAAHAFTIADSAAAICAMTPETEKRTASVDSRRINPVSYF